VVIYPNPAIGKQVNILVPVLPTEKVHIEMFTTAFRKILDIKEASSGGIIQLDLNDTWGKPLANGLYYLFINISQNRWKFKILVLR
jgi:hypothetical protein